MKTPFARRTEKMGVSALREILKVISKPGMISLAGGLPAPESFPVGIVKKLTSSVLKKYGPNSLQYGPTEGFMPLKKALAKYLNKKAIKAKPEEVLISTGSQGTLDNLGKILINKGDKIAVESPTYLGALQAFNPYEPNYVSIKTDEKGIMPGSLQKIVKKEKIKFIYLVPTFQNPTGRTTSLERRKKIAKIIKKHNTLLIEDDPYAELRYEGKPLCSIKSLASENVVYLGSLSKVFAPGLRLGFCLAPKKIANWLALAKQGVDLHTSSFNQALAAEYINKGYLQKQIKKNIKLYRPRQKAMLTALEKYFPKSFSWSRPKGGMFIWVIGPKGFDAQKLYPKAIKRKVAFVPGKFFFAEKNKGQETMRLNFSMVNEKTIDKAIKRLSQILP